MVRGYLKDASAGMLLDRSKSADDKLEAAKMEIEAHCKET
jgi:hypothetical protein